MDNGYDSNGFNGGITVYLASAGTGKTTALLKEIEAMEYTDSNTAFVTFTRRGAWQGRQASHKGTKMFSTIHSRCFRTLKINKKQMLDKKDLNNLEGYVGISLRRQVDVDDDIYALDSEGALLMQLASIRRVNPALFERIFSKAKVDSNRLLWFIQKYNSYKKETKAYDFTDILQMYLDKGCTEKNVETVCIDEAQDCSPLQWRVLLQAFRGAKRIILAGDDKQALFTFAGASPLMFTKFRGEQRTLDVTYRVPSNILALGNHVASLLKETIPVQTRCAKEGGKLSYISDLDELGSINPEKSYLFLAYNKATLVQFTRWLRNNGVLYTHNTTPLFTQADVYDYEEQNANYWRWPLWKKSYADSVGDLQKECNVDVSTIHGAKGMEADVVVLSSDLSSNTRKAFDIDMDSIHRAFYVGATRAKEALYVMLPHTRFSYPYLQM